MPRIVRLYPHDVATGLQLRLLDAFDTVNEETVDLSGVMENDDDEPFVSYDVSDPSLGWTELSLSLEADLASDELKSVLPKGGDPSKDLALVVSVRCAATKTRDAFFLEHVQTGKWEGDILLRRANARGSVDIVPMLARTTARPGKSGSSVAVDRSAIVAQGSGLRFVVDRSDGPIHGDIDFKWEDFRKSESSWRRDHDSDVFHLDPSREQPQLFLNTRYRKLKAALLDNKRSGVDAVVRNLSNAALAQSVWIQLFVVAAGSIRLDREDGNVEPPAEEWKRHVLRRFGGLIFPERNEADRLRAFAEQMNSGDQIGTLMSKAGSAAQEIVGTYKLVESAIRAGERGETK